MIKRILYRILKSPVVIVTIACITAGVGFYYFQYDSNFERAVSEVKEQIEDKNSLLADSLFYKNNTKPFKDVMENLLITTLSSYRVEKSTGEIFVASKDQSDSCKRPISKRLILDAGFFVGKVFFCVSDVKLAKNTLASFPTLVLIFIILLVSIVTPIVASDKYLGIMLASAESPNESMKEFSKRIGGLPISAKEVLFRIRQKNDDAKEASKLLLQLENENRHKDVLELAAHDVGRPIKSLLKTMRLDGDVPPQEVKTKLDRALAILDSISRETGNDRYSLNEITNVSVAATVNDVFNEKSPSNPKISFELKCENDLEVNVSENDFYRVIANLVANSCDALKKTKNPKIKIEIASNDGKVSIQVSDNGPGMPDNVKNMAFIKKFSSGKVKGTGLGLYFVHKKMNEWGGKAILDSNSSGTTFTLILNEALNSEENDEKNA